MEVLLFRFLLVSVPGCFGAADPPDTTTGGGVHGQPSPSTDFLSRAHEEELTVAGPSGGSVSSVSVVNFPEAIRTVFALFERGWGRGWI